METVSGTSAGMISGLCEACTRGPSMTSLCASVDSVFAASMGTSLARPSNLTRTKQKRNNMMMTMVRAARKICSIPKVNMRFHLCSVIVLSKL